jgi:transcriptional regulator with XRE-family HTH domain
VPAAAELKRLQKAFGANVRRERNRRGMTQERLAELADLSLRNIQRVEAGELNVLMTTVVRIRRALGCSWEELMPPGWK